MAKDLSISYLLDFYGQMLTDKQREVTEFYYNDDLSLAEIADHCHITRCCPRRRLPSGHRPQRQRVGVR